jgi:hypothetical protein
MIWWGTSIPSLSLIFSFIKFSTVAFALARSTPARVKAEARVAERAQFSEAGILKLGL